MTHPLIETYYEEARREEARRARTRSEAERVCDPLTWATRYRRIDGQSFTLDHHKPLLPIYQDDHPHIVVMKCAQVGLSEMAVTRALHALDVGAAYWQTGLDGLNIAYLFPTADALRDFSKERISGVQAESDHLSAMFRGGFDDVGFKQVGNSYLYLRGAWTRGDGRSPGLKSFKADVLIRDEYDEMSPQAISMSEKRLRASVVRRCLDISTPTLPGRGIHAAYMLSDQRVWEVPCPHCTHWQELDFFRDVRGNGLPYDRWRYWNRQTLRAAAWTVQCQACAGALDRFADGRWSARQPDVTDLRGYHIPALCFPIINLATLAVAATSDDPTQVEEFFRSDLGQPYSRAGTKIDPTMLDAVIVDPLPAGSWTRTTMGVDVGARMHVRITSDGPDRQRYVRYAGAVESFEALDTLIRQYGVRSAVIDAQPELNGAKQWVARWPGRAWRAFYPNGVGTDLYRTKDDERVVQVNRTMAMDRVYAEIAGRTLLWARNAAQNDEVRAHLSAPQRVSVQNKLGQDVTQWVHTAPDHLYHASVYDLIARELLPPVETIPIGLAATAKVKLPGR